MYISLNELRGQEAFQDLPHLYIIFCNYIVYTTTYILNIATDVVYITYLNIVI